MEKLLAIAILTYNDRDHVSELLYEIEKQLLEDVDLVGLCQVVVSDNASTDGTGAFLNMKAQDSPLSFDFNINKFNQGLAGKVEQCIRKSTARYIHLMGSDDIYEPHGIRRIIDKIRETEPDWLTLTNNYLMVETGAVIRPQFVCKRFGNGIENDALRSLCISNCVFRADLAQDFDHRRLPTYCRHWPHLAIMINIVRSGGRYICANINEATVTVRLGNQGWGSKGRLRYYLDAARCYCEAMHEYSSEKRKIVLEQFQKGLLGKSPRQLMGDAWIDNLRCALDVIKIFWGMKQGFVVSYVTKLVFCKAARPFVVESRETNL